MTSQRQRPRPRRSGRSVVLRIVRFELRALLLTVLGYGLVFAASPLTAPGTSAAAPRVVIIVGPAGRATDGYRADGDRAAKAARAAGADVTTVYSPDATWPTVKAALQGASIVVYMGHGNGFPSRYGPVLRKTTKDGLGLNPVAGIDDVAHQYFGEAYLARHVRLAPHAVVLLHHLCYASGNSEPGLPEGDLETGQQRVDNMAAGWLAAGAEAVLAEAYGDPAPYVSRILAGASTIETIWRTGPTAHDHVLAFPSSRTPGMTALMDPTKRSSGFYRSLVVRADLRADEVAAGAALLAKTGRPTAGPPSAPRVGPAVSSVTLRGASAVGSRLDLALAFEVPGAGTTPDYGVGVRWDPIVIERPEPSPPPADRTSASAVLSASPQPADPTEPAGSATARPTETPEPAGPSGTPEPAEPSGPPEPAGPAPIDLPIVAPLVVPESLGEVVALVDVDQTAQGLTAEVVAPDVPGLYRLVTTVHDPEGAALASGDKPIPALLVRVTSPLSAIVATAGHVDVTAGSVVTLPVAVMNSGTVPWAETLPRGDDEGDARPPSDPSAMLAGHWVRLDMPAVADEYRPASVKVDALPGATDVVSLGLSAPDRPGEYLLILDVISRLDGSLIAAGGEPVVVRITVTPRRAPGGT